MNLPIRRFRFSTGGLALLALCLLGATPSQAQDQLVFKDNRVQAGKVVGLKDGAVVINVPTPGGGTGQLAFNLGLLSRVDAAPPPAFNAGLAAYNAGDWDKALAALKPVVDGFRGLPIAWAQQATGLLGDLYVEKNDLGRAEAAYNDYRKFYPAATAGNSLRFGLGQARITLARNNVPQAKAQLEPITRLALKDPGNASRADAALYGQAFYVAGQIQEREGNLQAALEDYLRTTTLFYQDSSTAARAQKGADALRATHKDLVAP